MSPRSFLAGAIALAAGIAVPQSSQDGPLSEPPPPARPNILFLLADDLGYGDLGCFGNPVIRTPHLDRLARQGMRLTACYSASPNCSPARAGILTGRHPYRVGMFDVLRSRESHLSQDELTLAEVLRAAGYATFFAGKWHLSGDLHGSMPGPSEHGFEHWFAHHGNFGPRPQGFLRNGKALPRQSGWMSERVVDEAVAWLEDRDDARPFCALLWFSEPHNPVCAAPEFLELYQDERTLQAADSLRFGGPGVDRRRVDAQRRHEYFACVSMLDHHIGRLLDHLERLELSSNTLVVFTSDNGPDHRSPAAFGSPGPWRGAKGHLHEGGIRVPGILRWPAVIPSGTTIHTPVHGTDFLPTFAALAGAPQDSERPLDGVDLGPLLRGRAQPPRTTPLFWWSYHARGGSQVALRSGAFKILASLTPQLRPGALADAQPPDGWSVMRFIKEAELTDFRVYDLEQDPGETRDLGPDAPALLERLRKRLVERHHEIRAEAPHLAEWSRAQAK